MEPPSSPTKSRKSSVTDKDSKSVKSARKGDNKQPKDGRGGGWMNGKMGKMTGWLHTSEPSVQALMGHKKEVFQKAGVTPNDDPNEVSVRVRAPVGDVPENAISPIGGPAPEETLKKKRDDKRWRQGSVTSGIAESITGRSSSSGASIYAMKGSVSSGSASTGHPFDDWTQGWQ